MSRAVREVTLSVILAVVLFFGIDSITARSYVEGQSMEPTLHQDQVLLISRLGISGFTGNLYSSLQSKDSVSDGGWVPPRGMICTFVHPTDPTRVLVKRVIGLPGEDVSIDDGVVSINGQPLDEPYVVFHDNRTMGARHVPADSIYVMGDNRPASNDSRIFGPVPRTNLVGVAILRYWPLNELSVMWGE